MTKLPKKEESNWKRNLGIGAGIVATGLGGKVLLGRRIARNAKIRKHNRTVSMLVKRRSQKKKALDETKRVGSQMAGIAARGAVREGLRMFL